MTTLENKKIIFILGSLELGGSEKQALLLARYLAHDKKCKVQFFGFSTPGKASELCDQYGIPWKIIRNPLGGSWWKRKIKLILFAWVLRREKPDILLPFAITPNVACGLVWRWTGAESCVWNQRNLGINRRYISSELKAAQRIPLFFSNSKAGEKYLIEKYHLDPGKVHVIHNGVESHSLSTDQSQLRKRLGFNEQDFLVCMVANLSKTKDHVTLLKAWRKVMDFYKGTKMNPVLLLAGQFLGMEEPLRALAIELNLGNQIKFLGQVNEVNVLLEAVDLGVFSSISEGCPNGVLECMAAGLAVAGTDISGVREAVGPEGYPYLAVAGNDTLLAERIIALINDPETRKTLGKLNKERIKTEFSIENMCSTYAELLNNELI